jgi:autoinducer 2-degrading protein
MLIAMINVHVKPEFIKAFSDASLNNARNSIKEAGVTRFDIYQQQDDPSRFILCEIYQSEQDVEKHRSTAHYTCWRDTVAEMMAEPRQRTTYSFVFPVE